MWGFYAFAWYLQKYPDNAISEELEETLIRGLDRMSELYLRPQSSALFPNTVTSTQTTITSTHTPALFSGGMGWYGAECGSAIEYGAPTPEPTDDLGSYERVDHGLVHYDIPREPSKAEQSDLRYVCSGRPLYSLRPKEFDGKLVDAALWSKLKEKRKTVGCNQWSDGVPEETLRPVGFSACWAVPEQP